MLVTRRLPGLFTEPVQFRACVRKDLVDSLNRFLVLRRHTNVVHVMVGPKLKHPNVLAQRTDQGIWILPVYMIEVLSGHSNPFHQPIYCLAVSARSLKPDPREELRTALYVGPHAEQRSGPFTFINLVITSGGRDIDVSIVRAAKYDA